MNLSTWYNSSTISPAHQKTVSSFVTVINRTTGHQSDCLLITQFSSKNLFGKETFNQGSRTQRYNMVNLQLRWRPVHIALIELKCLKFGASKCRHRAIPCFLAICRIIQDYLRTFPQLYLFITRINAAVSWRLIFQWHWVTIQYNFSVFLFQTFYKTSTCS